MAQCVYATFALGAFLREDHSNFTVTNFVPVAQSLIKTHEGISNLQLAPLGVVEQIHPLSTRRRTTDRGAIGHNLMVVFQRRGGALAAIKKQTVVVIGPVTVLQGGVAYIIHTLFVHATSVIMTSVAISYRTSAISLSVNKEFVFRRTKCFFFYMYFTRTRGLKDQESLSVTSSARGHLLRSLRTITHHRPPPPPPPLPSLQRRVHCWKRPDRGQRRAPSPASETEGSSSSSWSS